MVLGNTLKPYATTVVITAVALLLSSCLETESKNNAAVESIDTPQVQATPEPELKSPVETDSAKAAGIDLILLDNNGACQLDDGSQIRYMKPMAPCYFVRQAGTLQQHKKDKITVIAAVGTPLKERCGQEVQGLLIEDGVVSLSKRIGQGSIFCADKGLDSYHFSLF